MIKIGNNNKINKSIIGNNKNYNGCNVMVKNDKEKCFVLKNIIIPVVVGLIIAGIVFLLKWN